MVDSLANSQFLEVLALVLLGHLLYDIHWQGHFIGEYKSKKKFVMFIHCLTYALFLTVLASLIVPVPVFHMSLLFLSHFIIDSWKTRFPHDEEYFWTIYVDQTLHFIVIIIFTLSLI